MEDICTNRDWYSIGAPQTMKLVCKYFWKVFGWNSSCLETLSTLLSAAYPQLPAVCLEHQKGPTEPFHEEGLCRKQRKSQSLAWQWQRGAWGMCQANKNCYAKGNLHGESMSLHPFDYWFALWSIFLMVWILSWIQKLSVILLKYLVVCHHFSSGTSLLVLEHKMVLFFQYVELLPSMFLNLYNLLVLHLWWIRIWEMKYNRVKHKHILRSLI